MIPGEYFINDVPIIANKGRNTIKIKVSNSGDRPIQVGSHTHFFETNKALVFSRKRSYGFHLNIPAGTSVRFEPGDTKEVEITEYSGLKRVYGFSGLVNGDLATRKQIAIKKAQKLGFKDSDQK
ncbi:MAG: urease subunit beta [Thaumarchaeota archaeon]|nr:urease subunit beta [Nitrososphaerota archaeon]MDE1866532.1 urease subunit beta [Nitrososphaerota archaeon]